MSDVESDASSTVSTDMDDMLDQLDREHEAWRPEPGDKIVGILVDIHEVDDAYKDTNSNREPTYPMLTLDLPDGRMLDVHAFHTILRNEIRRRHPQIGDVVGIKYLGQAEKAAGDTREPFHNYRTMVKPSPKKDVQ